MIDVDYNNKLVKLLLYPECGKMELKLPFDNVLYSVYQNCDPDKLYANQQEFDPNKITSEAHNIIHINWQDGFPKRKRKCLT